jgi:polygalacturonase
MRDRHHGVVIGIEIPGGCRNVFVESCKMESPNLDHAMRLRSNARRVEIISVGHVAVRPVKRGRWLNSPLLPANTP